MDSANIERISKALANETRVLIFEAIARNKEMTCQCHRSLYQRLDLLPTNRWRLLPPEEPKGSRNLPSGTTRSWPTSGFCLSLQHRDDGRNPRRGRRGGLDAMVILWTSSDVNLT